MKKILCVLLAILMSCTCIACAEKTNNVSTNDNMQNNTSTENVKKENNQLSNIETEETEPTFDIKLSFVGDCMLATYKDQMTSGSFNEYSKNNPPEYFLSKVKNIFEDDDFTTVNLENVFSDQKISEIPKSGDRVFWFKSNTSNVKILTSSSVEGVSLANNHTNDYGKEGYNDTIMTVENAGLKYGTNNEKVIYYEKEGFKIAVICSGLWGEHGTTPIINKIKEAEEKSDYQVVFYHGGTEGIHKPEEWKQRASRKLIDNGADLVIGNHPHVLQPIEEYNGKTIVYSLGNFCYGGHRQPKNRTVIFQKTLTIDKKTMNVNLETDNIIPCYVYTKNTNNYQPTPITNEEEKQRVLDFMNQKIDTPY